MNLLWNIELARFKVQSSKFSILINFKFRYFVISIGLVDHHRTKSIDEARQSKRQHSDMSC